MLAAAFMRPEHLKGSFGPTFQSMFESAGRLLLNAVSQEFDVDKLYGGILSSVELFQIPGPEAESINSLKQWRDRVRSLLKQLPSSERPPDEQLSRRAFEKLERVRALALVIERMKESF